MRSSSRRNEQGNLLIGIYIMIMLAIFATGMMLMYQDKIRLIRHLRRDDGYTALMEFKKILNLIKQWEEREIDTTRASHFSASFSSDHPKTVEFLIAEDSGTFSSHEEAEEWLEKSIEAAKTQKVKPDIKVNGAGFICDNCYTYKAPISVSFDSKTVNFTITIDTYFDFNDRVVVSELREQVLQQVRGLTAIYPNLKVEDGDLDRFEVSEEGPKGGKYLHFLHLGTIEWSWNDSRGNLRKSKAEVYAIATTTVKNKLSLSISATHNRLENKIDSKNLEDKYKTECQWKCDDPGNPATCYNDCKEVYDHTEASYRVIGKGHIQVNPPLTKTKATTKIEKIIILLTEES